MKDPEPTELLPRPRSLLIAASLIAASVTYHSLHMATAIVGFSALFKDLGVTPSVSARLVFSMPRIWWLFALASIAVLIWVATQSQVTPAAKRRMKAAMFATVALTAITYGVTAYAIYTPLLGLRGAG